MHHCQSLDEVKENDGEEEKWYQELHLSASASGTCIITMRLKNRPAVTKTVEIIINSRDKDVVYYLDGADEIRLDRYATYHLIDNETKQDLVLLNGEVLIFSVTNITDEKIKLATNAPIYDDNRLIPCAQVLHANA